MDLATSSELVLGPAGGKSVLGVTFGSFGESCVTTAASVSIFHGEPSLEVSTSAVASWAPPESAKYGGFTLPAYTEANGASATIWAVQGGNQLLSWSQSDANLSKVRRSGLHSPAFAIMPCAVTRAALGKKQSGAGDVEKMRVVIIMHSNGDLSVLHGTNLAPLASWTAVLEVPTSDDESSPQQPGALLWCTAVADGVSNNAALDVAANTAKELLPQAHLQPGASAALALLKKEQSASSDASESNADNNTSGGASMLVLQRASSSSRNEASTGGVVLHVLRLDATSPKDSSPSEPQAFALNRSTAHTFAAPSTSGKPTVAVAGQAWAVQAAFGGSTLSLLWSGGAAAVVQAFEFPKSARGSAGSYSSTPTLLWQRQLRSDASVCEKGAPRLAALGSDHVALLMPVGGVATSAAASSSSSSSCLALVDIRHGVVVARTSTFSDDASRAILASSALGQGGGLAACMLDSETGAAATPGSSSGAAAFATLVAYSSSTATEAAATLPVDASKSTGKKGKKGRSSSVDLSAELAASSSSSASALLVSVRTDRRAPPPGSLAAIVGRAAADSHSGSDPLFLSDAETTAGTAGLMVHVNLSLHGGSSCSALGFGAGGGVPRSAHWHTNVVAPAAAAEAKLVASVVAATTQRDATVFAKAYASLLAAFTSKAAAAESTGAEAKKRKRSHEAAAASEAEAVAAAACAQLSEETVRVLVACAAAFPHPGSLSRGCVRDLLAAQRLSGRSLFFPLHHHNNDGGNNSNSSSGSTTTLADAGERLLPWLLCLGELSLVEACVGVAVPDLPDDDVVLALRTLLGGLDDASLLEAASSAGFLQHHSISAEGEPALENGSSRNSSKKAPKSSSKASSAKHGESSADPMTVRAVAAERLLACALAAASSSSSHAGAGGTRAAAGAAGAAAASGGAIAAPSGLGAARRSLLTSACRNMDEREAACVLLLLRKLAQRVADGERYLGGGRRSSSSSSSSGSSSGGGGDGSVVAEEGAEVGRAPRVPLPNLGTIAEWCSALLDAHFTAFLVGQHRMHGGDGHTSSGSGGSQAAALTVGLQQLAQLVADEVAAFSLRTDLMARIGVAMANSAEQARRQAAATAAAANPLQGSSGGRNGHGSGGALSKGGNRNGGFGSGEVDESAMQEYSVEVFSI